MKDMRRVVVSPQHTLRCCICQARLGGETAMLGYVPFDPTKVMHPSAHDTWNPGDEKVAFQCLACTTTLQELWDDLVEVVDGEEDG